MGERPKSKICTVKYCPNLIPRESHNREKAPQGADQKKSCTAHPVHPRSHGDAADYNRRGRYHGAAGAHAANNGGGGQTRGGCSHAQDELSQDNLARNEGTAICDVLSPTPPPLSALVAH